MPTRGASAETAGARSSCPYRTSDATGATSWYPSSSGCGAQDPSEALAIDEFTGIAGGDSPHKAPAQLRPVTMAVEAGAQLGCTQCANGAKFRSWHIIDV